MGFVVDLQASCEFLVAMLQRNYTLMQDLDQCLQGVQWQNELRCEQEIQDIRRGVVSGNIRPSTSLVIFSDEALDEQKRCLKFADEKVDLAIKAHAKVDTVLQQVIQYIDKVEEVQQAASLRTTESGVASGTDGSISSRSSSDQSIRGDRNKTDPLPTVDVYVANPLAPNEPRYCFCNKVSYGHMVACDNPECKIVWFHFGCVGLRGGENPKGHWYCCLNCGQCAKSPRGRPRAREPCGR